MAASANFALKAGAWFRRGRLLIVSPDSLGTACPLSGRNSTYRPVQISGTSSVITRTSADWVELKITAKDLEAQVTALRASLKGDDQPFDKDAAYKLYQATFG